MSQHRVIPQHSLDAMARCLADRRDAALEMAARFLDEALESQATADHSDRLDSASPSGTSSEESYALASHANEVARDAELALARIADGTYGVCGACGANIPLARLRALPSAILCVGCAARTQPNGSSHRVGNAR